MEQEVGTDPAAMSPAIYKAQFKISLSPWDDFIVTYQDLAGVLVAPQQSS